MVKPIYTYTNNNLNIKIYENDSDCLFNTKYTKKDYKYKLFHYEEYGLRIKYIKNYYELEKIIKKRFNNNIYIHFKYNNAITIKNTIKNNTINKKKNTITKKNNNTDLLLTLLNNCSYDIKEMVFNRVDNIKQKEYYKNNYYEIVLYELNNKIKKEVKVCDYWSGKTDNFGLFSLVGFFDKLNIVYVDFFKTPNYQFIQEAIRNKTYYEYLDFILDCKCNTIIDIENDKIIYTYKIKDNCKYKYEKNYTLDTDRDYIDNEDFYGIIKKLEFNIEYDLNEWVSENEYNNECRKYEIYVCELMENDYNDINRDNDILKDIIYKERLNKKTLTFFNVFYS